MNSTPSWRDPLEPPAGGLARLAAAIEPRQRPRRHTLPLASGAAVLLLLGLGIGPIHHRHAAQRDFTQQWRHALEAERQEHGIARELPSSRADVRIVVLGSPRPSP